MLQTSLFYQTAIPEQREGGTLSAGGVGSSALVQNFYRQPSSTYYFSCTISPHATLHVLCTPLTSGKTKMSSTPSVKPRSWRKDVKRRPRALSNRFATAPPYSCSQYIHKSRATEQRPQNSHNFHGYSANILTAKRFIQSTPQSYHHIFNFVTTPTTQVLHLQRRPHFTSYTAMITLYLIYCIYKDHTLPHSNNARIHTEMLQTETSPALHTSALLHKI